MINFITILLMMMMVVVLVVVIIIIANTYLTSIISNFIIESMQ